MVRNASPNLPVRVEAMVPLTNTTLRNISVKRLDTGEIFTEQADVVIAARGNLNDMKWPAISGLETFTGQKMHSAAWDDK